MAYISQVKIPGTETPYDLADRSIGLSTDVTNSVLALDLVRDGEGSLDITTINADISDLQANKQDTVEIDTANEMLIL